MKNFVLGAVLVGSVLPIFCQQGSASEITASEQKPRIVATTSIVADTVRAIAANDCEVKALMGPGVDPHLYRASHGDLTTLSEANVIFFNGLHLEGKMQEIFQNMKKRRPVIGVAEAIDVARLRQPAEFEGQYDPHVWFDVRLWSETILPVEEALAKLLPAKREVFKERASAYRAQLESLDRWVREQLETIPQAQRVLITAHDAFGYFGSAYGFEVAGLQGISTVSEFGLMDVQRIVNLIIERKIKAIFVESSVPQRFVESIQAGVSAKGGAVTIGGTLYSDALGDQGSGADSYIGMVRSNVATMVHALK